MPEYFTLTLEETYGNKKFTVNIGVSDEFIPNDQKEIQEHMIMKIVYNRICEMMFRHVPIVNAKSDMIKAGLTEREFDSLGIADAVYPVDYGNNSEMNVFIK